MTSNRALKKDDIAKMRLISQIEKFAIENGIKMKDLYNIEDMERCFLPELHVLEARIQESDAVLNLIEMLFDRWCSLYDDIKYMQVSVKTPNKWRTLSWEHVGMDVIPGLRYVEAQRRSNYRRRAWELRTFIDACLDYHEKAAAPAR